MKLPEVPAANTADFETLFLRPVPMMDMRAPAEFVRGTLPGACSLPLMSDDERAQVGTCYKTQGEAAAIALGHRLVSGTTKAQRLAAWARFAQTHPDGYLFCFRGGLRSQIVQQWLYQDVGIAYPRVLGGYKAVRTYLIDTLDRAVQECQWTVLGGLTGCGKTEVLQHLPHALDLEGHAHHRGSSFGKRPDGQPSPIDFEHRLAVDLLRRRAAGMQHFVVEDEGRMIGSCALPLALFARMGQAPVVWLEDTFEHRVQRILQDYVLDLCRDHQTLAGPEVGFEHFAQGLQQGLRNITKRLGLQRYLELQALMDTALTQQRRNGAVELHLAWIERLLNDYYDPMYTYQQHSKAERVVFRGNRAEVLGFLARTHP
jgi:tRNA 2-selenouridine synthase